MASARLPRNHGRLLTFVACISLLGLTTSVGLAWVAAVLVTPESDLNTWLGPAERTAGPLAGELGQWDGAQWTQRGLTSRIIGFDSFIGRLEGEGLAPPAHSAAARLDPAGPRGEVRLVEKECGWPLPCLRVSWGPYDPAVERQPAVVRGGIPCDDLDWGFDRDGYFPGCFIVLEQLTYRTAVGHTALPLIPMWPGIVGNTALFAGAWGGLVLAVWPMLALPGIVRRRVRRARGRCRSCGYDLAGLDGLPCPECGPTRQRSRVRVPVVTPMLLALLAVATLVGLAIEQHRTAPRTAAVFVAAERGDINALRHAAAGADLAARGDQWKWVGDRLSSEAPLAWAAAHGHADAVAFLLAAGPDPWTTHTRPVSGYRDHTIGGAALDIAAERGHAATCRVLLEDLKAHAVAEPALAAEFIERVRYLAYYGAHDAGIVAMAIDAGFTNSAEWSLLRLVAARGDTPALALALEASPDPAALATVDWNTSALAAAYERGHARAFEMLLAAGANPRVVDADGRGLLFCPIWTLDERTPGEAQRDRVAVMQRAASAELGLGVDATDGGGKTPLMLAVYHGDADLVRVLLAAGADPSTTDKQGSTAFDYARGAHAFRHIRAGHVTVRHLEPNAEIVALLEPVTRRAR